MIEIKRPPKWRIYLIKAFYFLVFVGLGKLAWSEIIGPDETLKSMEGIVWSFYAAFAVLMGLGIRYPLKMIPLIMLQLFYKSIWVLGIYLPMKKMNLVDATADGFLKIMVTGIVLDILVIPWSYVYKSYLKGFLVFVKKG